MTDRAQEIAARLRAANDEMDRRHTKWGDQYRKRTGASFLSIGVEGGTERVFTARHAPGSDFIHHCGGESGDIAWLLAERERLRGKVRGLSERIGSLEYGRCESDKALDFLSGEHDRLLAERDEAREVIAGSNCAYIDQMQRAERAESELAQAEWEVRRMKIDRDNAMRTVLAADSVLGGRKWWDNTFMSVIEAARKLVEGE